MVITPLQTIQQSPLIHTELKAVRCLGVYASVVWGKSEQNHEMDIGFALVCGVLVDRVVQAGFLEAFASEMGTRVWDSDNSRT